MASQTKVEGTTKTTTKGSLGGSPAKPEKIARITQGGVTCIFPVGCDVLAWPTGDDGSSETCRLLDATPAGALVECKGERIMVPWWFVEANWNQEIPIEAEIIRGKGQGQNETAEMLQRVGELGQYLQVLRETRLQIEEALREGNVGNRGALEDLELVPELRAGLQKIAAHIDAAAGELVRLSSKLAYPSFSQQLATV